MALKVEPLVDLYLSSALEVLKEKREGKI